MAVETSRAPIPFPSRQWDGREHMIESLAKLEGKPADSFFLARVGVNEPSKRPLYPDSPTSVVNSLMSPSPLTSTSLQPASLQSKTESELQGQQSTMQRFQQPAQVPHNSGGESRGNSAPRKSFNEGRGVHQSGRDARNSQGDDGDDGRGRKNGKADVKSPERSQSPNLQRERELAFEGNQQQPKNEAPVKQDFFTKIKIAMCAAPNAAKSDMEESREIHIGWPTNVKHLVHVSFDRFRGFVGLPEDMGEDQKNAPGASLSVFGVKPESLQVTWDGNHKHCVPAVLVMLQERLVAKSGLRTEGVFRIAAESAEEEYIRSMLNKGEEPPITDVHVLAGLIKAWFRELPAGVLDALTPDQVAAAQKEAEVVALVKQLPDINRALLDWAVDLMSDVVERQSFNKMNSRNIAMVFAPNMTQVMDPLKALMHAVKVMNLLKVLIEKRLRERRQAAAEEAARVEREMLRLAEEEEMRIQREEEARLMLAQMEEEEARLREREAEQAERDEGVHTETGQRWMEGANAPSVDRTAEANGQASSWDPFGADAAVNFIPTSDSMKPLGAEDCPAHADEDRRESVQADGSAKEPFQDEDAQVSEAMSLPVSRSELLVLVTELERKDELLAAPEEEKSGELAVVREKVDITLEHDEEEEIHVTSALEGKETHVTSATEGQANDLTSALDGQEKEPRSSNVFGEEPV